MTIEQMLLAKLEPHSKRIKDGEGNDFDYLPAVLLQLLEVQKRHSQQLDENAKFLDSIKNKAASNAADSKTQIAAFEISMQTKLVQLEATTKDLKAQIENAQTLLGKQIEFLIAGNQRAQAKFLRLLIAGIAATIVTIGLAITILQRHY